VCFVFRLASHLDVCSSRSRQLSLTIRVSACIECGWEALGKSSVGVSETSSALLFRLHRSNHKKSFRAEASQTDGVCQFQVPSPGTCVSVCGLPDLINDPVQVRCAGSNLEIKGFITRPRSLDVDLPEW
jgi:hypothetical protein